jgi:hypothetical protein
MAHDRSHHNQCFLYCECSTDADPRPNSERKIGETINFCSLIATETGWDRNG